MWLVEKCFVNPKCLFILSYGRSEVSMAVTMEIVF
jgi:hypothetical protein